MSKKLLIFDLDGTLYQTDIVSIQATKEALCECGHHVLPSGQITVLFGETMENFCLGLLPEGTAEERKVLAERISYNERRLIPEMGQLYPGIIDILQELRDRGYTLAICSNGDAEYIDIVLRSCGISDYFTYCKGRHPEIDKAGHIKELLEEYQPTEVIMVGDTQHDYKAARVCQIPFIGVDYGFGDVSNGDFIARNVTEMLGHILRYQLFGDLLQKILQTPGERQTMIVGINGVDTSGKTQFAKNFAQYLRSCGKKVIVVHLDDFHNPSWIRGQGNDPIQSYLDHAFDLQLICNQILIPLHRDDILDCSLTLLDLQSDTYTNEQRYLVEEGSIVLVEGILLFREPIDQYFDSRIFLEISFDEVLRRAEVRDVPLYGEDFLERYRTKYIPIQQQYFAEWQPKERADIIIDNEDFLRPRFLRE